MTVVEIPEQPVEAAVGSSPPPDVRPGSPETPEADTEAPVAEIEGARLADFRGEKYVDVGDIDRELKRREEKRFFIVPDGSGRRQTLDAGTIGATGAPAPPETYPVATWQVCRVIVPLLAEPGRGFHELRFPVSDGKRNYGGYLLEVPTDLDHVTLWSYQRKGQQATPVLARVDAQGRVTALVNNMPTLLIPESGFRYARNGGRLDMRDAVVEGGRLAVLDGALLFDKLPRECGMQVPSGKGAEGLVTLQFTTAGRK